MYTMYMRNADTLFSGMEAIGGFFESLMHIGLLVVFFFQERLFKSSFMRQIYQTAQLSKGVKIASKKFDEEELVETVNQSEVLEDTFLRNLLNYILLRDRFRYGYKDLVHYLSNCLCIRTRDRKNTNENMKKHVLYDEGNKKLEYELDVVNLIRSIRQLRLMAQVLLGPSERMLLKFQRKNMIESSSSSEDSDDHKNDTVKLLTSEKGLIKLQTVVKINRILKYYYQNKNLEEVDKNLIKGVFIKKPLAAKMDEVIKKTKSIFAFDFNQSNKSGFIDKQNIQTGHHSRMFNAGGGSRYMVKNS